MALIDTGSAFSIVRDSFDQFEKIKINPIYFTTITGRDAFHYEIQTPLPDEIKIKLPSNVKGKIKWKVRNLSKRKYDFIIGVNILSNLDTVIDLEEKVILLNGERIPFINNPYEENEVCTLEETKMDYIKRLKLDHLNKGERMEIEKLVQEFQDVCYKEGDILTCTTEIEHEIKTNTDAAINAKLYRYPPKHELEVKKQIEEMERQGIIRKSKSKYSSPLLVIPKKSDNSGEKKYRICIDYRALNAVTEDDQFPIPNIEAAFDKLGRAQYFSVFDLAKGYYQIPVKEQDRHKTAFITPQGLYEFVRMPFGLKNAPRTFQRLINHVLRKYINIICIVYLDDILVFSTSWEEHLAAIRKIFKVLRKYGLKLQIDKCNFVQRETNFLGHVITKEGLKPNPEKIRIIQNLPLPKTEKQVKSFLGITGYYRKFIKDYAKIAQPMTKYLTKNTKINPNDPNFIESFEKLKTIISTHPVLKFPEFGKPFQLTTDASNYAIGAVLSQNGHPVCYASRTLSRHEQNYSATDKEFLAIMWSVQYFRPYLYGNKFSIFTDHQPIKFLQTKYKGKDLSPRHQRWLLKLGEYDFQIEYLKGKENKVADFLSRIKTTDENIKEDNPDNMTQDYSDLGILFNIEDDQQSTLATIHSAPEELQNYIPIKEEIVNKYRTQLILTNNKTEEFKTYHGKRIIFIAEHDFENLEEILTKYIKKGITGIYTELEDHKYNIVQEKIIEMFTHDKSVKFIRCSFRAQNIETEVEAIKQISLYHVRESLHSGINETFNALKFKIYFPKLLELITVVISQCDLCQEVKYDRHPIKSKFNHTETANEVNEIIQVDIFTIKKCNFLTIIDTFSKFGAVYYLPDKNHYTVIEQFEDHFAKFDKPKKILAGNEFSGALMKNFFQKEQIILHLTKPHSHTGIADVERFHSTLIEKFRTITSGKSNLSARVVIQQAVRNYNNRYHSTIKCTPKEVQTHKVDFEKIRQNIEEFKEKRVLSRNKNRENYKEDRKKGFIKNYKATRQKHIARFRKAELKNVHPSNIRRKLKYADQDDDDVEKVLETQSQEKTELPINEEQREAINKAINGGSNNEVLVSRDKLNITRSDIKTLGKDEWLNDNIINCYMNLIQERSNIPTEDNLPTVYTMNTHFVSRLIESGYKSVERWTKRVNIFSFNIILFPVHVNNNHWALVVVDFRQKTIRYYDSMGNTNPKVLDAIENYLKEESLSKLKKPFDIVPFKKQNVENIPRQDNGNDCGVFSCIFAEVISRNKQINFTQENIPYFRDRMIVEILEGKLFH